MGNFLPDNYVKPVSKSNYFKFEQGENKFRILSPAITGWLDWTPDKKPLRSREERAPLQDKRPKHFWAFLVWDYATEQVKVLEITQATIQNSIYELHMDSSWGDPKGYDINVKKKGEKLETEYTVVPTPPAPLTDEIKMAYGKLNVTLEKLYENGDPFEVVEGQNNNAGDVFDEAMEEIK